MSRCLPKSAIPDTGGSDKGEDFALPPCEKVLPSGVRLDSPDESVDLFVGEMVPEEDPCDELPFEACGMIAPPFVGVPVSFVGGKRWELLPLPNDT